jgi:hypothetical protein
MESLVLGKALEHQLTFNGGVIAINDLVPAWGLG